MNPANIRIGIVAGEASGDILGSGLIKAIKQKYPNATFEGIAGPLMLADGCKTSYAMEELSVMGLVEVLGRLRRLMYVRKQLAQHFIDNPPDVFIGIDAPDFNLGLEQRLKEQGIKTVHYVSPSVWAWRKKRISKIQKAADLVLCLLPFEQQIYKEHNIASEFVGHTLADEIPLEVDQKAARATLGIDENATVLALLPGSRGTELAMLAEPFLQTAVLLQKEIPDFQVVIPVVNDKRKAQLLVIKEQVAPDLNVLIVDRQSREVMTACDVILLASGTATLEAMLCKRPMVVAYKFKWLSYQIFKRMIMIKNFSLPNLLAGKALVPEVLQEQVEPQHLFGLVCAYLASDNHSLINEFDQLHRSLRLDASEHAALAVIKLINGQ
jgi:lipid-A-disaccharide synthase